MNPPRTPFRRRALQGALALVLLLGTAAVSLAGTVTSGTPVSVRDHEYDLLDDDGPTVTRTEVGRFVVYAFTFGADDIQYLPHTPSGSLGPQSINLDCDGDFGGGTLSVHGSLDPASGTSDWYTIDEGGTAITCTADCEPTLYDGSGGASLKYRITLASSTSPTLVCNAVIEKR